MGNAKAKKLKKEVAKNFRNMMESGILLYMENRVCKPDELSNMVCESGSYMADYVIDETGRLCEVRYDKICKN